MADSSEDTSILWDEPPEIDPYEVLGIERAATPDKIKSAYRKAALKHHPDKVPEDEKAEAHEKFQTIAFAYGVLSDPVRRQRYDTTGSMHESTADSDGFSWGEFYRDQFRDVVNEDAIAKFAQEYKGSDEEKDDVLASYESHKGDMNMIYEEVMLSNPLEDEERFRKMIDEAIANKDARAFKAYTHESKKARQARFKEARREAGEAEEYAKELGVHDKMFGGKNKKSKKDSEQDLAALIQGNQRKRDQSSFLDNLAAKYAGPSGSKKGKGKGNKKRSAEEEPDEEAFQAAASRLKRSKK